MIDGSYGPSPLEELELQIQEENWEQVATLVALYDWNPCDLPGTLDAKLLEVLIAGIGFGRSWERQRITEKLGSVISKVALEVLDDE